MASAKLHIEGAKHRPEAIKHYLDFIDRRDYDSIEDVMNDVYRETGIDIVNTKGMQTTLAKLGIVEQSDRQQLTARGRELVDVLLHDEELFCELLHFNYATAYHRDPSPDRAISWAYYQISNELRRRSPTDFSGARQEIVEAVEKKAKQSSDESLADPGPLSTGSLNNYQRFIEQLEPTVFDDATGDFTLRSFARSELVLAAIDHLYRTDVDAATREYGDPMRFPDDTVELLCSILLVQEEDLADVIEHVASMDARLSITPDYELSVRLSNPVEINDFA